MRPIINTREDLEALKGTEHYAEFIQSLKGSMIHKINIAEYPEDYNTPEYDGQVIDPIWEEIENLETITRFGFTKEELQNL
jgi:hypothetical protein